MALWGGRFAKETAGLMREFSSSIATDARLWQVDIQASRAHARMLTARGILSREDGAAIERGLSEIKKEIAAGEWTFDPQAEDIHGEIERRLGEKVGEAAKRLHTARSRNDQVATDTRLFLGEAVNALIADTRELQEELLTQAEAHVTTILPGMTHLQHAQPVSLAHHLLAYFWMFARDAERLGESLPRIYQSPLGAAALAGTGFPIDREMTAAEMGFSGVIANSLDAVSDRDFVIEFLSDASLVMMHLSRFCEELILWSTPEFAYVELGDEVTTGSSIMPQKKNPDGAELIRGRVGRVYGALVGALTMMKALPLAYNRDMQEDKIHLFAALDTVGPSLKLMTLMLKSATWNTEKMRAGLAGDFSNATDLADDLAAKGVSFREAHEVVGRLVQGCLRDGKKLENLSLKELQSFDSRFDEASLARVPHLAVMEQRRSLGGTAPAAVREQIESARTRLNSRKLV